MHLRSLNMTDDHVGVFVRVSRRTANARVATFFDPVICQ